MCSSDSKDPRDVFNTRNGSTVVITSGGNNLTAVVLNSNSNNFKVGDTIKYSSEMGHFMHCKNPRGRNEHDRQCVLHEMDLTNHRYRTYQVEYDYIVARATGKVHADTSKTSGIPVNKVSTVSKLSMTMPKRDSKGRFIKTR